MKDFQTRVGEAITQSKNPKEVVILFPYAGRSTEESGCKSEGIPNGMEGILSDPGNMFCTMSSFGQRDALPGGGGGSALRSFSMIKPIHPHLAFGESFVGGDKTLDEIHTSMLTVAESGIATYKLPVSER